MLVRPCGFPFVAARESRTPLPCVMSPIPSAKVLLQRSGQCEGLATLVLTYDVLLWSAPRGGLGGRVDGQVSPAYLWNFSPASRTSRRAWWAGRRSVRPALGVGRLPLALKSYYYGLYLALISLLKTSRRQSSKPHQLRRTCCNPPRRP